LFTYKEFEKLNDVFGKVDSDRHPIRSVNPRENPTTSQTRQYADILQFFQELITQYPVILFLDSLDQLSNQFEARSELSFLKFLKPHSDSRIIVSCLPDEWNEEANTWRYHYYCDTRLSNFKVPRVQIDSVLCDVHETEEGVSLSLLKIERLGSTIASLLLRKNRRLTFDQMKYTVSTVLHENFEPSILYLNLIIQGIQSWKSWQINSVEADCLLRPNVQGMINLIFDSLETKYGRILTRRAFALLTYSREGKYRLTYACYFYLFILFNFCFIVHSRNK
jgi:hypothetical protein